MPPTPQTSFIPKQSAGPAAGGSRQHRSFNVLTFISTTIFLATLALSVGVFFYKKYNADDLAAKKIALTEKRSKFPQTNIEEIRNLDYKFQTANLLLNQHLSLTRLFDALEVRTQGKVELTSFSFKREESGTAKVALAGSGPTFNTIVLQERGFKEEKSFEEGSLIFSDLTITPGEDEEDDKITFKVSSELDPKAVAYEVLPDIEENEGDILDPNPVTDTVPVTEVQNP